MKAHLTLGGKACTVFMLYAALAIGLPAQTLTTLYTFSFGIGQDPTAALVQATNGDLYGEHLVRGH